MHLCSVVSRIVLLEWPVKRERVEDYNVARRAVLARVIVSRDKIAFEVHVNLVIPPCIVVFTSNVLWVHAVKIRVDDNSCVQTIKLV